MSLSSIEVVESEKIDSGKTSLAHLYCPWCKSWKAACGHNKNSQPILGPQPDHVKCVVCVDLTVEFVRNHFEMCYQKENDDGCSS